MTGQIMKINIFDLIFLSVILFLFSGCAALVVGGATVTGTGTYFYVSGEMKSDYNASFDETWNACEKTIADMRGVEVVPEKEIAQGKITTVINGENVKFVITY